MIRRITASLAAAAIVLTTAHPTPALAMSDKDRQLLTLLLGAAAVGVIINESQKKREEKKTTVSRRDDDRYERGYHSWDRDKRWRYRSVPAQCVFPIRGLRGQRDVVSARCLSEFGLRRSLPAECAFDIDAGWGSRKVYGTDCLRRNGYRIASVR